MFKPRTSAKKAAKAARQRQPSTLRFEGTPRNGTITEGGKACSISGDGTVLCDRPIQRNTGLHEAEFKQTSNEPVIFGMASATTDLEEALGERAGAGNLSGVFDVVRERRARGEDDHVAKYGRQREDKAHREAVRHPE